MNDQGNLGNEKNTPERRKSPMHPAIASAILAILAFLVYLYGTSGSEEALSLLPIVPVLAVFSAGAFGYAVLACPVYALLSSVISLAAVLALSYLFDIRTVGDMIVLAFPVLAALVSGTSMGICTRKKASMTSTIIIGAAVPSVLIAAAVLIHSQIITGSPTETLRVMIAQVREETVTLLNEYFLQMKETLDYDLPQMNIEGIVDETFNVLPGTLVAMAAVLSFFVQRAMFFTAKLFGTPSDIPEETRRFEISMAAAVIYIAFLTVSLVTKSGIVNASAQNITICLLPGLAYAGAKSHIAERKNGVVKIGCLPLIIFIFLLYMNPAIAFEVLALFGSFDIIGRHIEKNKK